MKLGPTLYIWIDASSLLCTLAFYFLTWKQIMLTNLNFLIWTSLNKCAREYTFTKRSDAKIMMAVVLYSILVYFYIHKCKAILCHLKYVILHNIASLYCSSPTYVFFGLILSYILASCILQENHCHGIRFL